ncbi:MAG: phage regulatory CII family protein [Myxococcota bacterium]
MRSPEEDRAARKREASRLFARAMHEADASTEVVAAQLGVKARHLRRYWDPDRPEMVPLADVLGLPPAVRRVILEALADIDGFTLVEAPPSSEVIGTLARIADMARETGEALVTSASAVSDGYVDAREARDIIKECRDARAAIAAVEETAHQVVREGVIGVAQ